MACFKAQDFQNELLALAKGLGVTVQELLKGYVTAEEYNGKISAIELDIKKITEVGELDTESIAEKVQKINDMIGSATDDTVKSIFDQLSGLKTQVEVNTKAVNDLATKVNANADEIKTRVANVETSVKTISDTVTANKNAQDKVNADVEKRLTTVEEVAANAGKDIDEKIDAAIADEVKRTNLLVEEVDGKIADIKASAEANKATVATVKEEVAKINAELNDTKDADGNLVKGLNTKVADVEAAVAKEAENREAAISELKEEIAKGAGEACFESGIVNGIDAANAFRNVFGLAPLTADNSNNSDSNSDDSL